MFDVARHVDASSWPRSDVRGVILSSWLGQVVMLYAYCARASIGIARHWLKATKQQRQVLDFRICSIRLYEEVLILVLYHYRSRATPGSRQPDWTTRTINLADYDYDV